MPHPNPYSGDWFARDNAVYLRSAGMSYPWDDRLAVVESPVVIYSPDGKRDEEATARYDADNARLMAASPKLLAACKAYLETFADISPDDGDDILQSLAMARAAVKAAEGDDK